MSIRQVQLRKVHLCGRVKTAAYVNVSSVISLDLSRHLPVSHRRNVDASEQRLDSIIEWIMATNWTRRGWE